MRTLLRNLGLSAASLALLGATTPAAAPPPTEVIHGLGFDACAAPPLKAMRAWYGTSPYRAVGIYVSGGQRHCAQPELTAEWVRQVRAMGWRLIPAHVGMQAPCNDYPHKTERFAPARAGDQGRAQAQEAVRALTALGIGKDSPVYLDIESYAVKDAPAECGRAVVDAVVGWTRELHRSGYRAGFYSSLGSGVRDLAGAARAGRSPLPEALWYARWDQQESTADQGPLTADLWPKDARIHQFAGNVKETWGGETLTIDRNRLDGPAAR
ncbi:DUF1906 domain-containing protein [Streptomyces sp. NPDC059917]|uniref:DUF1906 domain-containing protein n=1 Tax=Streptomyces sp. NPDC059917 TaxID=3347002 RepID=UPI0036647076